MWNCGIMELWKYENGNVLKTLVISIISYLHIFTFAHSSFAAPVSPERAVDGVSAWVARGPASTRLPTGEVRTFSRDGIDYFHLVGLTGGGWVAMPADDAFSPVFAFDQSGELPDKDDGSPCWMSFALECGMDDDGSSADARDFRFDVEAIALKPVVLLAKAASASASESASPAPVADLSWGSLDGDTAGAKAWRAKRSRPLLLKAAGNYDNGNLIDVRVASFLPTRWNQAGVNGEVCYNYYTPPVKQNQNGDMANAVCGCVATAMAQTMWHYKFPTEPVNSNKVYTISTRNYGEEKVGTTATMKGGAFDWDNMTADPQNASDLTEVNREAIGKLTYNCGLAVNMNYGWDGSNNGRGIEGHVYESEFGYGGSEYVYCGTFENFANSLFANFDARQPCTCNIPGHEVVGDGYGFSEGAIFVHLNMGWGGSSDLFYRQLGGYSHIGNKVGNIVCNISTNGVVRYVTGRVTDMSGAPLSGASVRAEVTRNGLTTVQNLVTDDKGIYAVRVEGESNDVIGSTVALSATMDGLMPMFSSRTAYTTSAADGNSWGNDFVMLAEDSEICRWTGGAGDCKFSTPGNWENGIIPTDIDNPIVVFNGCGEMVVTNDLAAFSPDLIIFSSCSGVVTLRGKKIVMPDGGKITSYQASDATMPVMDLAVEYEKSIAVDGGVKFNRGVTGVDAASVSRFIGNFVLTTTDEWTGSGTIEAGSSVTVEKFYSSGPALTIEEGGVITTAVARVAGGANLVKKNDGLFVVTDTLTAGSESSGNPTRWTSDEGSKGSFVFNRLRLVGNGGSNAYMFLNARNPNNGGVALADMKSYVVGSGGIQADNSYLSTVPGWPSTPIRCCADYAIEVNEGGASKPVIAAAYNSGECLYLDTSDWKDASVGHTITVNGQLQNNMRVGVLGCGTFHFAGSSTFSNGLEVKDTATLAIDNGVMPGASNVTMNAGTTLALPDYSGNPMQVEGKFSTSGSGAVHVKICGGAGIRSGTYPIVSAKGGIGSVNLVLDGIYPWQEATFSTNGNTVSVTVVTTTDLEPGLYIGPSNGDLSDSENWSDGKVPTNGNATFTCVASVTLTKGATFAPASITFAEGCSPVTINGDFTTLTCVTNNSSVNQTFAGFVDFGEGDIDVTQTATYTDGNFKPGDISGGCVVFAGGVKGNYIVNHTILSGHYELTTNNFEAAIGGNDRIVINDNSSLSVKNAGNTSELYIRDGATFNVENFTRSPVGSSGSNRLWYWNKGTCIVTNCPVAGDNGRFWLGGSAINGGSANANTNAVLKIETLTINRGGSLALHCWGNNATTHMIYIGAGGVNIASNKTGYYMVEQSIHKTTLRPWNSDFTFGRGSNADYDLLLGADATKGNINFTLNTDDEAGVPRTVTMAARIKTQQNTSTITVAGSGTNVVTSASPLMTGTYAVTDTATVKFTEGTGFANGMVSVGSAATLAIGESATVNPGNLVLADGAALAFNWTERAAAPVLDMTGRTVTVNGTVKVVASADALIDKPDGGSFVVTSGFDFTGKTVELAEGSPYWALGVHVNDDGNIVLDVKHSGAIIRLK